MPRPSYFVALCILVVSLFQVTAQTQPAQQTQTKTSSGPDTACAMPVLPATSRATNIFNDEQEEWLGDVIDQTLRRDFHVVEDPDGYLQKLGERLLAQLPPTKMHYRFIIVDAPDLNSFGTAGGCSRSARFPLGTGAGRTRIYKLKMDLFFDPAQITVISVISGEVLRSTSLPDQSAQTASRSGL